MAGPASSPGGPLDWPEIHQLVTIDPAGTDDGFTPPPFATDRQLLIPLDTRGAAIRARKIYTFIRRAAVIGTSQFCIALYRLQSGTQGQRSNEIGGGTEKRLSLIPGTKFTAVLTNGGAALSATCLHGVFQQDVLISPAIPVYVSFSISDDNSQIWLPGSYGLSTSPVTPSPMGSFESKEVLTSFAAIPAQVSIGDPVSAMPYVLLRSGRGIYLYGSTEYDS